MQGKESARLAIITGASSGIGLELALCCAKDGYEVVIAADDPAIEDVAQELRSDGTTVDEVHADLAVDEGIELVVEAVRSRPVEVLIANAGHGLGQAFLDQTFEGVRHVIDTNVTGTLHLIHRIGQGMRSEGRGKILIVGSVAGFIPGSFHAVYNASKAFVDSFAQALRNELKDTGITVTCLMPGPTETEFFERAGLMDTKVGQAEKADPADVAKVGYEAMQKGKARSSRA